MVHASRASRRWSAYAAAGVVLALLGQSAASEPPGTSKDAKQATAIARQAPRDADDPTNTAALESDTQRVAAALEAKNTYDKSTESQKDAHEAAGAAREAANWAAGMGIAAWLETVITGVGVGLVGLTLRQVKITADETKNTAKAARLALNHAKLSTQQELRAYVALEGVDFEWTDTHAAVVQVSWKNNGSTPTVRAITQTNVRMEDSDIPTDFDFPDLSADKPGIVSLGPGQHRNFHTNEKIHEVDIAAVQSGYRHIHVWGWIEYSDVFEQPTRHRSEFCSVLKTIGKKEGKLAYVWNSYGPFNGTDGDCYRKPTT